MRVSELGTTVVSRVRYVNAARRGVRETAFLPVLEGKATGLPDSVDALLVASDLQGVVPDAWDPRGSVLLGEALAAELEAFHDRGLLPPPGRVGVVLAGDLYAAPSGDVRGATGDVRAVWEAFADRAAWVVGVAGNHDTFGSAKERRRLEAREGLSLLDPGRVARDGASIGGVSYIVGDPRRPGRVAEADFLASLELVLDPLPKLLVMHEGPHVSRRQRGHLGVTDVVSGSRVRLVVCGHVHWDEPLGVLPNGTQVLNVDARAVILRRA